MRAMFLGSPEFAVPSLRTLHVHPDIEVALVVTQPDRPAGRGSALTPCAVKIAADELGLQILQPATLRDATVVDALRETSPDLLVVVAYGEILQRDILNLAPHGCVNVHPSLLPRYRGATPIPAAILAGDIMTGVSIIRLVRRLDAGPIISQRECAIDPRDTSGSLSRRLAVLAADFLPGTLLRYCSGEIEPIPQDESLASYTREWRTEDARIDWNRPAIDVDRLVRASHPWPIAWTTLGGQRIRILDSAVDDSDTEGSPPGAIHAAGRMARVATGRGWLKMHLVQPAGKRPMSAGDWLRGLRLMSTRFDADDSID